MVVNTASLAPSALPATSSFPTRVLTLQDTGAAQQYSKGTDTDTDTDTDTAPSALPAPSSFPTRVLTLQDTATVNTAVQDSNGGVA
jgi:hypothetical protein